MGRLFLSGHSVIIQYDEYVRINQLISIVLSKLPDHMFSDVNDITGSRRRILPVDERPDSP